MTAQDSWPKVGGDAFFYSEANRFASAGNWYTMGSSAYVPSGTATVFAGSIQLLPGSFLTPFTHYIFDFAVSGAPSVVFAFSGGGTDVGFTLSNAAVSPTGVIDIILVSGNKSHIRAMYAGEGDTAIRGATNAFNTLNLGSTYFIKYGFGGFAASGNVIMEYFNLRQDGTRGY